MVVKTRQSESPFSSGRMLDEDKISIVLDAVKEYMSKSQSAMIIVEHNIARASEISTRLLKVKDGKLVNYDLQNHDLGDSITRGDEVVS